jgi:hypothetical protein
MKKLFFIGFALLINGICKAQKFKPDFIELSLQGENVVDTDLTVKDVFKVTGFPDFEREGLTDSDFSPNGGFSFGHSAFMVKLGYRSFNNMDSLKFTDFQLGLFIGSSRGFSNVLIDWSTTRISRTIDSNTVEIDSFHRYAAVSGFSFDKLLGLEFALTKTIFKYKVWSLNAGFAFDLFWYGDSKLQQRETTYISYSEYFEPMYYGDYFKPDESVDLKMFSFGIFVPVAVSYNPKLSIKIIDRSTFSLCYTYGYRAFTIPDNINFTARVRGIRLILRYNLF